MEPFSYSNSDHASDAAPAAAPASAAPAAATEQPAGEAKPFNYEKTDQAPPQGVPTEHLPEAVRALREQRAAESFFSVQNDYRDAGLEDALASVPEFTDEVRTASAAEYREIFADLSLTTGEARDVVTLTRELTANPPDEATEAAWQAEARAQLERTYGGAAGAKEALDLAKKFVARDPRVAFILEHTRLGNHPKVIQLLVAKARSARAKL